MKIVLTGGTGFIGQPLADSLMAEGHTLTILSRSWLRNLHCVAPVSADKNPSPLVGEETTGAMHSQFRSRLAGPAQISYCPWNPPHIEGWQEEIDGADAVVNLAGEPVAAKRWTRKQKLKILESRCDATQAIVQAIHRAARKPKVLVNASAVGYYGPRGSEDITERDEAGHDFLAKTCKAWEAHALRAEDFGVRVVRLRIGVVLEKGGGALGKMIPPFRFFLGGPLGNGRQWVSWIHREDVIGLIGFALAHDDVRGPLNTAAPFPVTMNELAQILGKIMHRPALAPVPAIALRILLGDMAQMLLTGQKVLPEKALRLGYKFRYPTLKAALEAILN